MGFNDGYRILSIKAVTVSTVAVLSTAVMLHLSGPSIVRFASTKIPRMYGSLLSWLRPPYLYVVINGIIISIAASSQFQNSSSGSDDGDDAIGSGFEPAAPVKVEEDVQSAVVVTTMAPAVEEVAEVKIDYVAAADKNENGEKDEGEEEEEFVISRSIWDPKERGTVVPTKNVTEYSLLTEKLLVSARLGRRKSFKASPEAGRALRVAHPKRNDTLESTWKAITDGRAIPLTRHLKKSDTWESTHAREGDPTVVTAWRPGTSDEGGAGGGVRRSPQRKEASLGQDDLNRRVEAFIKKFNEEMRTQRAWNCPNISRHSSRRVFSLETSRASAVSSGTVFCAY